MALKKSELYSSLWASCDELRGGMDASQYKDYVLFMLFIKYITDKYGNSSDFAPPVTIPSYSGTERGSRPRSILPPALTPNAASCSCRATSPNTHSSRGSSVASLRSARPGG